MTEPLKNQRRPLGLCEGIALLASSERAWTADRFDPAFLFGVSYTDLREAVALGREVKKLPNKDNLHGRVAECIRARRDDVNIRFKNWQPTEQQRNQPN